MCHKKYARSNFHLSRELIVDILKRLPVKTLLRFMSVCKSWYFLIKNPKFISTHFDHQIAIANSDDCPRYMLYYDQKTDKYYVHSDTSNFDRHLELSFMRSDFEKIDSCNGYFCFASYEEPQIILWNPSLRKSLNMIAPCRVELGYEGLFYGFGFWTETNDYKIIVCVYDHVDYDIPACTKNVYIYSMSLGTWRHVSVKFQLEGDIILSKERHVNGVMHWLVKSWPYDRNHVHSLLMFNLADEEFSEIPLPKEMVDEFDDINDDAALLSFNMNGKKMVAVSHLSVEFLKLWVLDDDVGNEVKSRRKTISVENGVGYKRVVNARWNGEIILETKDEGIVSLDHKTMATKRVCDQSMSYVGPYIENLTPFHCSI